jgi:hypothetical protein
MRRQDKTKRKWKNMKPHSEHSRKTMKQKYGSRCFLEPKRMKYPICSKFTGKQECIGLQAADYYLNINIGKVKNKLKRQDKTNLKGKTKKTLTKKLKKYESIKRKSDILKKKVCS